MSQKTVMPIKFYICTDKDIDYVARPAENKVFVKNIEIHFLN